MKVREVAGVPGDDGGRPGGAEAAGVGDVGRGQRRPAGFEFDPDGIASQVDRLDQGGADAAHRVHDQVAGLGVGGDGLAGDGRAASWPDGRSIRAHSGRPVGWRRAVGRSATPTVAAAPDECLAQAPAPTARGGLVKTSTSSWTTRCAGSPRARALRVWVSCQNDGRATSPPCRTAACRARRCCRYPNPAWLASCDGGGGEIIQATGAAGVLGHRHQQPTRTQQLGAAGQHLSRSRPASPRRGRGPGWSGRGSS